MNLYFKRILVFVSIIITIIAPETARAKEQSPICGMDELTFDTLLASLCVELQKKEEAKKYMSIILSNRNATKRVKDKIFDLKELLDSENGEDEE